MRETFGFGAFLDVHEVDAERSRQGSQGGVGTGVGSRRDAQQKRNAHDQTEVIQGQHRVQIVGFGGDGKCPSRWAKT